MYEFGRIVVLSAAFALTACADPNSPVNPDDQATLRFVNALANGASMDLLIGKAIVHSALPHGAVLDWRVAPSAGVTQVGVRSGTQTQLITISGIHARERVLLVAHGTAPALGVLPADTNSVRMDRVNVRVVLAAPNAPLVKAYVQPQSQSALGPLPWVSTQSPYVAPLFTTYYRGTPSAERMTVIFAEYNPGGSERILAVSPPFDAYSGSAWLVTFDQTAGGYTATVAQEPVPLIEG